MRRLPPMSSLRAFEAAARHGSFKHAAIELAVTPTAISHQVRALEEYLGGRLFDRRTRQVVLTADAQPLYVVLREGFDSFADAVDHPTASRKRAAVTSSPRPAFPPNRLHPHGSRFLSLTPSFHHQLPAPVDMGNLGCKDVHLHI